MDFETLLYREEDGIAYVTLNRPEVQNCFNLKMIDELAAVWGAIRESDAVRVAILTGAGEQAFCTGFDRNDIPFDVPWDPYTYDDPGLSIGPRVNRLWKPVIAAVNGTAAAGAFYLLGQVEFIIAAENATFVEPHINYTMPAVYETIELLAKIPFGEVMRMALMGTAERMSAKRAYEIGLVSEVVPSEELLEAADAGGTGDRGAAVRRTHGDGPHPLGGTRPLTVAGDHARQHISPSGRQQAAHARR